MTRVAQLQGLAREQGIHWLAVMPGPNMLHLTGLNLHMMERPQVAFIPAEGKPLLVIPTLETPKAMAAGYDFIDYDDTVGPQGAFAQARERLELQKSVVAVEGLRIRFLELSLLGSTGETRDGEELFATLRMRKSDAEIATMEKAVDIAQTALGATASMIKAGVTEQQVASELTLQIFRAGSGPELPFSPIVAAGLGGSTPHAVPGDRKLVAGDLVTIDWGASHDHYFSDITRTFVVPGAEPSQELRKIYDTVRESNEAGIAAARPGATGQDIDRAARRVIEDAGYGEYFTHRTGHGLGMDTHEEPYIKEGGLVPLEPGMTFTVEPGIYVPNLGGVRIEDDVVITKDGARCLTTLPKELKTPE